MRLFQRPSGIAEQGRSRIAPPVPGRLLTLALSVAISAPAMAQIQPAKPVTPPIAQAQTRPAVQPSAPRAEDIFDENALDNCLKLFQAYKADDKGGRLLVRFTGGRYRCRIHHPRRVASNQANVLAKPALARKLSPARPTELRYWRYQNEQKLDGQVVVPQKSEYLATATISPSDQSVFTFVFDTAGMPDFQNAVVQLNGLEEPKVFPTGSQQPSSQEDPCKDWDHPTAPIAQFTVPVTPAQDAALSPTHRQVKVDIGKTLRGIPNHTSQYVSVRLVPITTRKGVGPICLNGPATNTVALTAAMEDVTQNIKEAQKKQSDYDAERNAATGPDGKTGSPITVEVATFLPEFISAPYSYLDELVTIVTVHSDNFPDGLQDFPIGCAFNVQEYLSVGPPKHWYDPVVEVLDAYAQLYSIMEHSVANLVVAIVTVGQCEPSNPIDGSGGTHSKFCDAANSVTFIAVQYAATLVGLPPSLPTASSLTNDGLTWAATQAVDYGLSYIPGGGAAGAAASSATEAAVEAGAEAALAVAVAQARELMIEKVRDGMFKALKLNGCYFQKDPTDGSSNKAWPSSAGPDPSAWRQDKASGCYTSYTEIYSVGTKNFAYYPRDAIIYLRVKKNPHGINISKNVNIELDLGDYYNAHAGSPFAVDHRKILPIHVDELPPEGALIPVTLYRSYAKFVDAARANCVNCLDVDQAEDAWLHQAYETGVKSRVKISSEYVWTDSTLRPDGTTGIGRATASWLDQGLAINKDDAFGNYSFRNSVTPALAPACPGFIASKFGTTYVGQ
ncbi:hypothetical protein [Terrarubrum flagellatum]|uniref:hypothetical protein n=1 Tax=Terrirubrum flagellatum TaxID=2895980 RepID=UPI003144F483